MLQFRVERNAYGQLYIFCRDYPHKGTLLERMVALRQRNRDTGLYR